MDHHAPKLEIYGKSLFIVLRTAELAGQRVVFGHSYIFLGPDYIITVRRGPSTSYAPVKSRCEADPDLLRLGVDYVLYELMTFVLDHYVAVIAQLQDAGDAIDARIEAGAFERGDIHKLYALRRELVRMRRITAPTVEICARLRTVDVPGLDERSVPTSPICMLMPGRSMRASMRCVRFWISGSKRSICRNRRDRETCRDASRAGRQYLPYRPPSPVYTA